MFIQIDCVKQNMFRQSQKRFEIIILFKNNIYGNRNYRTTK